MENGTKTPSAPGFILGILFIDASEIMGTP